MKITQELIDEIYNKSTNYLMAKYGVVVDYIRLDGDSLQGVEITPGCCGDPDDYEYYHVNLDELDLDLEELTKIREEEERKRQERLKQEREKREREEEQRRKEQRRQQYLNLKKEFE